jgi:hypothetical protein
VLRSLRKFSLNIFESLARRAASAEVLSALNFFVFPPAREQPLKRLADRPFLASGMDKNRKILLYALGFNPLELVFPLGLRPKPCPR